MHIGRNEILSQKRGRESACAYVRALIARRRKTERIADLDENGLPVFSVPYMSSLTFVFLFLCPSVCPSTPFCSPD